MKVVVVSRDALPRPFSKSFEQSFLKLSVLYLDTQPLCLTN